MMMGLRAVVFLSSLRFLGARVMIARSRIRSRVTWASPLLIFTLKLLGDVFVPFHHFRVWYSRESFPGDYLREETAIGVRNIPLAYCILKKLGMFIWAEK